MIYPQDIPTQPKRLSLPHPTASVRDACVSEVRTHEPALTQCESRVEPREVLVLVSLLLVALLRRQDRTWQPSAEPPPEYPALHIPNIILDPRTTRDLLNSMSGREPPPAMTLGDRWDDLPVARRLSENDQRRYEYEVEEVEWE